MPSQDEIDAIKRNLLIWAYAVDLSLKRLTADEAEAIDRQTDARFLAVAIRNVLRGATWAYNVIGGEPRKMVLAALTQFDNALPDAVDVRDILEHFDAYAQGRGERQKDNSMRNPLEYYVRYEKQYALVLADSHHLDAQTGAAAAMTLADSVLDALS